MTGRRARCSLCGALQDPAWLTDGLCDACTLQAAGPALFDIYQDQTAAGAHGS